MSVQPRFHQPAISLLTLEECLIGKVQMQKDQATCGLGHAVLDVSDGLLGFGLMPRGRNADLCAFKTPN